MEQGAGTLTWQVAEALSAKRLVSMFFVANHRQWSPELNFHSDQVSKYIKHIF